MDNNNNRDSEAGRWQPIETAPKDGTVIDLWRGGEFQGRLTDCYWGLPSHECGEMGPYCDSDWHGARPGWVDGTFGEFVCTMEAPTHWMRLPEPPESLRRYAEARKEKSP